MRRADRSEFADGADKQSFADHAAAAYEEATQKAASDLPSTHPIRLGLALNYSVFKYEAEEKHADACAIAKKAFDDAMAELDQLDAEMYKDATLIMQLLKDNLTLWQDPE